MIKRIPGKIISGSVETFVMLSASALMAVTYFSDRRSTVFELICLGALALAFFSLKVRPRRELPDRLLLIVFLYLTSEFVGALLSADRLWALAELRRLVYFFIAGFLFITPISERSRAILIVAFLATTAFAGLVGVLQYFNLLYKGGVYGGIMLAGERARGFVSHPILYAADIAFGCASAVVMLFLRKDDLSRSWKGRAFLIAVFIATSGGIIASGSRGVWIALTASCLATLFLFNRRTAAVFFVSLALICLVLFSLSGFVRQRAASIVTSFFVEDETGSTGTRIELWKGALILFREHPLLGVGTWNFQPAIEELIQKGEMKPVPVTMHAHNIYLHALATRGIIGFVLTIALFAALLSWGLREIRREGGTGGYIIVVSTLLGMVIGLTEINLDINQYLAANALTIGLIGPCRSALPEPTQVT